MEHIIEITKTANQTYFVFMVALLFINSIVKYLFDADNLSTRKIVGVASAFIVVIFWYFGAGFWKLIFCTFAAFGFFDWCWRYVERLYFKALDFFGGLLKKNWLWNKIKIWK